MRFGMMAAAAAALLCAGQAEAATVVKVAQYSGLQGQTQPVVDSRFDTSLGTLNKISVALDVKNITYFDYYAANFSTVTLPGNAAAFIDFLRPANFAVLLTFEGPLQQTVSGSGSIMATATGQYRNVIMSDFAGFLADGSGSSITANTFLLSQPTIAGTGRVLASDTGTFITATLTYDYTPFAAAVPEPATWAMMLLGVGVIGAGMRRRGRGPLALRTVR